MCLVYVVWEGMVRMSRQDFLDSIRQDIRAAQEDIAWNERAQDELETRMAQEDEAYAERADEMSEYGPMFTQAEVESEWKAYANFVAQSVEDDKYKPIPISGSSTESSLDSDLSL